MSLRKIAQKIFLTLAIGAPSVAFAQGYHLLAPINSLTDVQTGNFASYAQTAITLIIGLSAVLAVIMIMIGGFMYMGGESLHTKSNGTKYMQHAVGGLVLLLASYLILNTINPQLLNLNLTVTPVAPINPPVTTNPGGTTPGTTQVGKVTCNGSTCTYYSSIYGRTLTCSNCIFINGSLPIKAGQCGGDDAQCMLNADTAARLGNLFNSLDQAGISAQLNEPWPPTVLHQDPCQANGTCADFGFTGNTQATVQNIHDTLQLAANAGVNLVYEIQPSQQAALISAINAAARSGTDISIVNPKNPNAPLSMTTYLLSNPKATGPHFSTQN